MSKLLAGLITSLCVFATPRLGSAEWLYGLTASQHLVVVDTSDLTRVAADISITGLDGWELCAIDFRQRDGQLYGLARKATNGMFSARLYRLHMLTGKATPIGSTLLPIDDAGVGFDVNPVHDQIRVVTSARLNYRIDPDTGRMIDGNASEPGTQPDAPLETGFEIDAIAYSNKTEPVPHRYTIGLDRITGNLVRFDPPRPGVADPLNSGEVQRHQLTTLKPTKAVGMDMNAPKNRVYIVMETATRINQLYQVDIDDETNSVDLGQLPYPLSRVLDIALLRPHARMYAVTQDPITNKHLVTFTTGDPGRFLADVVIVGAPYMESLQGIDVQPTTGAVYAIGGSGALYRINPITGDAVHVAHTGVTWADPTGASFDPNTGHLRLIDTTGQHVRVDLSTTPATVVREPDVHNPNTPTVTGMMGLGHAFDPFTRTATLYSVHGPSKTLARLNETGKVTGATPLMPYLFRDPTSVTVDPVSNTPYAVVRNGDANDGFLFYQIDRGVPTRERNSSVGSRVAQRIAVVPPGGVAFEASSAMTSEAAGSVKVKIVRVSVPAGPFSIEYATKVTGSAQAGGDFTPVSGTLVFLDGEMVKEITIPIVRDSAYEAASESFTVALEAPTLHARVVTPSMTITIAADPAPPLSQKPSIAITAPTTDATFEARARTADVAGTASDDGGVVSVTWSDNRGHQGTAQGTTAWSIPAIALDEHTATIVTVTVRDADNQTASDTLTITPPAASPVWTYVLAEGATGPFFDTDILLANPRDAAAAVTITFLKEDGGTVTDSRTLSPLSRMTVRVDEIPGLEATVASAIVTSDREIIVERTMRWDGAGYGAHTEKAVDGPAQTWHFAEGSQGFFSTFVLLANPEASENTATIEYLREGESPLTRTYTLAPRSRRTIDLSTDDELANRSFGMTVTFSQPGVAERAMYFGDNPFWKGGHESAGVTAASASWFLAEGATGDYFDTFLLLSNPQDVNADVMLTFLIAGGTPITTTKTVAAHGRLTVNIEQEDPALANVAVATQVTSSAPIVVERAQYWPFTYDQWYEAHNAFGVVATATAWGLAEGRVGGPDGYETYILLANPGTTDATVQITFLRTEGTPLTKTFTVPAQSRLNIATGENGPVPELADEAFGARIDSDQPIAVERAMYSSPGGVTWSAGTNATATRLTVK